MKPERIQLSRKKGWRMPPNTVKVDRTTGYGNPFPIAMWSCDSKDEAAALSVRAFRGWITSPPQQSILDRAQRELRGKNLACWCKPGAPCHADVLLELANPDLRALKGDQNDEA